MEDTNGIDPLKRALFLLALQNAVKYKSVPRAGTVIGMVMGRYPEFRERARDAAVLVKEAINEVSSLPPRAKRNFSRPSPPSWQKILSDRKNIPGVCLRWKRQKEAW